jgi:hypothetical protein
MKNHFTEKCKKDTNNVKFNNLINFLIHNLSIFLPFIFRNLNPIINGKEKNIKRNKRTTLTSNF